MKPPRWQAAMVDLDGTLVDTLGDFGEALNRTLADLDLPPVDAPTVERCVGKGSEHLITSVLAHQLGTTTEDAQVLARYDAAWTAYQTHYQAINGQFSRVYPGALEGLQALRARGLRLACLTNKPVAFARQLLQLKGLDPLFEQVFGGDSFARKKPDPEPILGTCHALGLSVDEVLMVGDSSNDAQAARAAGCAVVLVNYGYNHGHPIRQTPALAWLDSLTELPALIH